jgi:hypothetical protein
MVSVSWCDVVMLSYGWCDGGVMVCDGVMVYWCDDGVSWLDVWG